MSADHHSEDWALQLGRRETEAAPEKPCHIRCDIASEESIIVVHCFERPRIQRENAVVCCPKIRIQRADREQRQAECQMRAVKGSLSCNHHNEGVLHGDVSRYLEAGPIQYPEEGPVQEEGGEGGKNWQLTCSGPSRAFSGAIRITPVALLIPNVVGIFFRFPITDTISLILYMWNPPGA